MSNFLLTEGEFREARRMARRGLMSGALYRFVERLVLTLGRSGALPPSLAPAGRWDDQTLADTVQEFITARMLEGPLLLQAFDAVDSPHQLSRYLERALRNWLVDQARASGAPRLPARALEILRSDTRFARFDTGWGLAEWEAPLACTLSERQLLSAAYAGGEVRLIRASAASQRAETVLDNTELTRLLAAVLARIGAALSEAQLTTLLRARFAFAFPAPTVGLDQAEAAAGRTDTAQRLAAEVTAAQMMAALNGRQLEMLRGRFLEDLTLEQLATRHGCSRGTADNELRRAYAALAPLLADEEDPQLALEILFEVTS